MCVYCGCELMRMRVWHVNAHYTVYGGLFLPSWVSDLPALIGFHWAWTAHRTGTTHFILGLYWKLIPVVPVHLQLSGHKKIPKNISCRILTYLHSKTK